MDTILPITITMLVRAVNNIGDWDQQPTSLTIRILPHWRETSYALAAFSILFVCLLFLFRWLILMRARLVHQAKLEHLEREKTEELYQFKMRFFTDISHEFRTPLSLILAPLQNILSKVESDPQMVKHSQIIRKNADRLLRLIEQVMDLRKIDLNKMKLSLSKGDIVAYVRELTYSFEEIAIRNDPDIIISDIIMPLMDGVEMCQKLKTDIRTSHIPVILLTAKSSMESKIEGLGTGADAYLEKPFSLGLLRIQINNILDNRKILRNKFSKELILKPSEIAITPVDAQFLQKAIEIVEKHMEDPDFSSDTFCHEIGMSRSQLHRKLKGLTSQPASEFIRTIRLKRAARLLEQSQLSIEEISYNVGFNSPAYFTKCFKDLFGKTPSGYTGD